MMSSPSPSAATSTARHASGSCPPCGAIPTRRASGRGSAASASAKVATMGMSPPKPSVSPTVLPAKRESMTELTRSGW